ncbi:protein SIEVE ELEMENT OCCLUSION B isoform X2 [Vigna radiata var. radiata]|uniref:Protein SIEVE ELEMENT OCCLUSION B isoform X2 n=1 Tax=Vigna radiata var. radiata TaxID=3916 RepID=A0A1S3VUS7_VIGRR|nr:protein SIEVE ELEMENT OCCLUSION B isoform X2 [Vigna radiata var. radiata]
MSSKQVSSNTLLQEKLVLNPFDVNDDQMLEKIYMTHYHCVEKYDVGSLHSIASKVIDHSIEIAHSIKNGEQNEQVREEKDTLISCPRFPTLKRISCQMICTGRGEQYAHQTTMLILEQLREYSWDAKAVIALAAFALEYGKFWQLVPIPRDKLGKSLAELNGLHSIMENMQQLDHFNNLVKKVMEVVKCITHWKKLITGDYNVKDVPALTDTLHEIPVLAYWTIITLVTCTSHIDFLGDKGYRYDLSKFDYKLDYILKNFKEHQDKCNTQIERIKDYSKRKDIINNSTETDIVKYLEALIIPVDPQDPRPVVYNVLAQKEAGIGVFKNKYVLLFISGTDNIDYETQLLISIDVKLREEPKEVEGYRKEDFSILWIPIVSVWDEEQRKKVENISEVGWYVVKEFKFKTGIDLIKEVFNYKGNPIILLISPQGKVENHDAKQIISTWGIEGFPFRTSDHIRLTQQWNWFWTEIKNLSSTIRELINRDCYIFIYGGTNSKWIENFSSAVEKLKNSGTFSLVETTIESYKLGSESPKNVPRFWITIDNMLASRKRIKKGDAEVEDSTTREIKNLLSLKQDPNGWAILTKGSHVKLLGFGDAMLRTVMDLEIWKEKLDHEVSFDVAFKDYYEKCEFKSVPKKCEHREFANYPTDILAHLPCPNKKCGHEMGVASVKYKCCHGLETGDIA